MPCQIAFLFLPVCRLQRRDNRYSLVYQLLPEGCNFRFIAFLHRFAYFENFIRIAFKIRFAIFVEIYTADCQNPFKRLIIVLLVGAGIFSHSAKILFCLGGALFLVKLSVFVIPLFHRLVHYKRHFAVKAPDIAHGFKRRDFSVFNGVGVIRKIFAIIIENLNISGFQIFVAAQDQLPNFLSDFIEAVHPENLLGTHCQMINVGTFPVAGFMNQRSVQFQLRTILGAAIGRKNVNLIGTGIKHPFVDPRRSGSIDIQIFDFFFFVAVGFLLFF